MYNRKQVVCSVEFVGQILVQTIMRNQKSTPQALTIDETCGKVRYRRATRRVEC